MGEAAPKDNSMEEILASIRRIIGSNDREASGAKAEAPKAATAMPAAPAGQRPPVQGDVSTGAGSRAGAAPVAPAPAPGSLAAIAASVRSQENGSSLQAADSRVPEQKPEVAISNSHPAQGRPGSLADLAASIRGNTSAHGQTDTQQKAAAPQVRQEPEFVERRAVEEPQPSAPRASVTSPAASSPMMQKKSAVSENAVELKGSDKPADFREALVSPATQAAVDGSIGRLREAITDKQAAQAEAIMRPMIKDWLDKNLPAMVERLVEAEISRIASEIEGKN